MKKVTCIIQARRRSSRLPDKIFKSLAGKPVLEHVVERCQAIAHVTDVVVASPTGEENDPIEELVLALGAQSYRGSEHDVLSRYWGAWNKCPAPYVMRVTSDCPLLDPKVCCELVEKVTTERAEYGALVGWPHGLDCEVFSSGLLGRAFRYASHSGDREHVTLWMKKQSDLLRTNVQPPRGNLHFGNRWVLDYPEDFAFLSEIFKGLDPISPSTGWEKILEFVDQNPSLRQINADCEKAWAEKTKNIYRMSKSSS